MMIRTRREFLQSFALLPLAGFGSSVARGDEKWPSRPVRLMVGFAPGGGVDAMARVVGSKLAQRLGHPVIVENKTGATGTICSEYVVRSAPDGYTLQLAHLSSNVLGPLVLARGKFHPVEDFTPIALLGASPQVLVHHPRHRFRSVAELIAYARQNPGRLSFASSGIGGSQHLAGEDFKRRAGVDLLHVPFKGTSEAIAAVLSGEVDMTFTSLSGAVPQWKSGKLAVLAVCAPKRIAVMPDIPAMAETLEGFEMSTWTGLAGPKRLPGVIVERLSLEMVAVLKLPEVVKRFDDLDMIVIAGGPREFGQFWRAEVTRYESLIREVKVQS